MAKKQTEELSQNDFKLKKNHLKIQKEFEYLKTTEDVVAEFTFAQAKEICRYFQRLSLTPLHGWKQFLHTSIELNKEKFFEGFYVIENEYGVLEPDIDRIDKLRINK